MTRTKLELVWPNKDKVLLRLDEHGEPVWGITEGELPEIRRSLEELG